MKSIISFLAIAFSVIACEKSPMTDPKVAGVSGTVKETGIVGTWKLTDYWQDVGNGTGQWIPADFDETITFGSDGSFSSTPSFPLYSHGYYKYATKNGNIVFYPGDDASGDIYQYNLAGGQMIFYPRCREMCMRRYVLVAGGK
jgi:hypothetical protein